MLPMWITFWKGLHFKMCPVCRDKIKIAHMMYGDSLQHGDHTFTLGDYH